MFTERGRILAEGFLQIRIVRVVVFPVEEDVVYVVADRGSRNDEYSKQTGECENHTGDSAELEVFFHGVSPL